MKNHNDQKQQIQDEERAIERRIDKMYKDAYTNAAKLRLESSYARSAYEIVTWREEWKKRVTSNYTGSSSWSICKRLRCPHGQLYYL